MTTTVRWDPHSLLDIRGAALRGEIQCPGHNRQSQKTCTIGTPKDLPVRCDFQKWKKNPATKAAQEFLATLAATEPSQVTTKDLRVLAGLCLCREYHKDQRGDVASRWKRIAVDAAAAARVDDVEGGQSGEVGDGK